MSVVVLNMKFIVTDIQFAPLNSILLFILNILLVNILSAEYSDEYPAGWYLVMIFILIICQPSHMAERLFRTKQEPIGTI